MHVTSVRQVYYTYDNAQKMGHVPEKTKNVHCRKPRLLSPPRAFDFERFRVKFYSLSSWLHFRQNCPLRLTVARGAEGVWEKIKNLSDNLVDGRAFPDGKI